ncbi:MAG: NHL repeat-containing protein [Thermotaleaceae bacterium]
MWQRRFFLSEISLSIQVRGDFVLKKISYLIILLFTTTGCFANTLPEPTLSSSTTQEGASSESKQEERVIELINTFKGFQSPTGIAVDNDGNLYVTNWSGSTVTKVDTEGNYSVFADGMGSPAGLDFDKDGNLYISDYSKDVIYKVTPDGEKIIFAQGLYTPTGITFNQAGELLVANRGSNEIVKVDGEGNSEVIVGEMRTPVGVVEDLDGNLYVTNYGGGIIKVTADGNASMISDEFERPGVGIDISEGNIIYAADNGDGCVRILNPDGTTEIAINDISGCVAVLVHGDTLYIGSWGAGAVYAYRIR